MTTNVEILVTDDAAAATLEVALGRPKTVRFLTRPSTHPASRLLLGVLSALDSSQGRARFEALLERCRTAWRSTPTVFFATGSGNSMFSSSAAAQALAVFSSLAGRGDFELYVAPDVASVQRLIQARRMGAQGKLIASASVDDGKLIVWSCEPKRYEVAVDQIPSLARFSADVLDRFEVSASGSRIHWTDADVDINLDTIRELVDPDIRHAHEIQARQEAAKYAAAIRSFREERGLKQSEIEGLTDRQIRRLEAGHTVPQIDTLRKLAAAHGVSINDYLKELASRSRVRHRRKAALRRPRAAKQRRSRTNSATKRTAAPMAEPDRRARRGTKRHGTTEASR